MAITLEQVEKLREKSGASYSDCKEALEQSDGDMLEALLSLERQGKSATAPQSGFYTTQPGGGETPPKGGSGHSQSGSPSRGLVRARTPYSSSHSSSQGRDGRSRRKDWKTALRAVINSFLDLFRHASENRLDVWRNGELLTSVPVAVLIILLLVAFWITIPLLVVGLCIGCRYHFTGPDVGRDTVHQVVEDMSDAVGDIVDHAKAEYKKHAEKKQ